MRLLFLTPQPPFPLHQGAAIRNWGFVSELARRHEVHLLCFGDPMDEPPPGVASLTALATPERPIAIRLADIFRTGEPDMARRLHSPAMAEALDALLARHDFDAVQIEGIEMLPYALPYLGQHDGPYWLYDAHNAEADLQRSAMLADLRRPARWHGAAYSALQYRRLARYEATHLPHFDRVIAVSDEDAAILARLAGVRALVIPNGIDTTAAAPERVQPTSELDAHPRPALLFTGKMDFRPNVDAALWFADEILPRIGGNPTFWIVGQRPHRSLERLRHHPQVVITGFVDEVEPFVHAADIVVVPLRMGSGTRLKVLQALSLARPVVGTTLGCTGLGLEDGVHLVLADEPERFATAIEGLLASSEQGAALGAAGRAHVREHFDWTVLAPRLEAEIRRLVG